MPPTSSTAMTRTGLLRRKVPAPRLALGPGPGGPMLPPGNPAPAPAAGGPIMQRPTTEVGQPRRIPFRAAKQIPGPSVRTVIPDSVSSPYRTPVGQLRGAGRMPPPVPAAKAAGGLLRRFGARVMGLPGALGMGSFTATSNHLNNMPVVPEMRDPLQSSAAFLANAASEKIAGTTLGGTPVGQTVKTYGIGEVTPAMEDIMRTAADTGQVMPAKKGSVLRGPVPMPGAPEVVKAGNEPPKKPASRFDIGVESVTGQPVAGAPVVIQPYNPKPAVTAGPGGEVNELNRKAGYPVGPEIQAGKAKAAADQLKPGAQLKPGQMRMTVADTPETRARFANDQVISLPNGQIEVTRTGQAPQAGQPDNTALNQRGPSRESILRAEGYNLEAMAQGSDGRIVSLADQQAKAGRIPGREGVLRRKQDAEAAAAQNAAMPEIAKAQADRDATIGAARIAGQAGVATAREDRMAQEAQNQTDRRAASAEAAALAQGQIDEDARARSAIYNKDGKLTGYDETKYNQYRQQGMKERGLIREDPAAKASMVARLKAARASETDPTKQAALDQRIAALSA